MQKILSLLLGRSFPSASVTGQLYRLLVIAEQSSSLNPWTLSTCLQSDSTTHISVHTGSSQPSLGLGGIALVCKASCREQKCSGVLSYKEQFRKFNYHRLITVSITSLKQCQ